MRTAHFFFPFPIAAMLFAGLLAGCAPQNIPPKAMEQSSSAVIAEQEMSPDHIIVKPADLQWVDAPPSLPAGAKLAVLEGDPGKPGPFTMRIMVPTSYRVPPHYHPADEHVTVVSGSFSLGMGESFDEKALTELPVGGFAMMRTGTRHFAWSNNGGVIQLHGIGPWGLTYVNPQDDPRNK